MDTTDREKMLELFDNKRFDKYPLDVNKYKYIGKRDIRRIDGYDKASGSAKYTLDLAVPGMLFGKFLNFALSERQD